jgi:hypothetical protein
MALGIFVAPPTDSPATNASLALGGVWEGEDGGRDRDRTCDPLDVNEVLSR